MQTKKEAGGGGGKDREKTRLLFRLEKSLLQRKVLQVFLDHPTARRLSGRSTVCTWMFWRCMICPLFRFSVAGIVPDKIVAAICYSARNVRANTDRSRGTD